MWTICALFGAVAANMTTVIPRYEGVATFQPFDLIENGGWLGSKGGRAAAFFCSAAWALGNMTTNITAKLVLFLAHSPARTPLPRPPPLRKASRQARPRLRTLALAHSFCLFEQHEQHEPPSPPLGRASADASLAPPPSRPQLDLVGERPRLALPQVGQHLPRSDVCRHRRRLGVRAVEGPCVGELVHQLHGLVSSLPLLLSLLPRRPSTRPCTSADHVDVAQIAGTRSSSRPSPPSSAPTSSSSRRASTTCPSSTTTAVASTSASYSSGVAPFSPLGRRGASSRPHGP